MKVVLKKTIYDRLMERLNDAKRERREVDYIVVSERERADLMADRRTLFNMGRTGCSFMDSAEAADTPFKTWEFRLRPEQLRAKRGESGYRPEYIKVTTTETFCGYPLLTVPAEYLPD